MLNKISLAEKYRKRENETLVLNFRCIESENNKKREWSDKHTCGECKTNAKGYECQCTKATDKLKEIKWMAFYANMCQSLVFKGGKWLYCNGTEIRNKIEMKVKVQHTLLDFFAGLKASLFISIDLGQGNKRFKASIIDHKQFWPSLESPTQSISSNVDLVMV